MLNIKRMRMQLPPGFEHRASTIARLVGESISEIHFTENRTLDRLSISPVRISSNATDQDIANSIVQRIASTLGRNT